MAQSAHSKHNRNPTRRRGRHQKRDPEAYKDLPEEDLLPVENGEIEKDAFGSNTDFVSLSAEAENSNGGSKSNRKRKRDDGGESSDSRKEKNGDNGKSKDDSTIGSTSKPLNNKRRREKGKGSKSDAAEKNGNETNGAKAGLSSGSSNARFIVFVGNLPYDTTQATLSAHLAPVKPTSIRVATHKPNQRSNSSTSNTEQPKCKGYAFVEFSDAGRMKTCLAMFHHSMFSGRKINVELTAGGGGKSAERTEKVRVKNEKLNEERKKKFEEERKEKEKKEKDDEEGKTGKKKKEEEDGEDGLHPSRRKMLKR